MHYFLVSLCYAFDSSVLTLINDMQFISQVWCDNGSHFITTALFVFKWSTFPELVQLMPGSQGRIFGHCCSRFLHAIQL